MLTPLHFSVLQKLGDKKVRATIPVQKGRAAILSGMGIEVSPYLRTIGDLSPELRGLPRMTPEQIQQFLVRARGM